MPKTISPRINPEINITLVRSWREIYRRPQFWNNLVYGIHTEIYAPKSIEIKIVFSHSRSQLIGHTILFTSEKRRVDAMIGYITISTSEQNYDARSPLLLADK